MGRKQGLAECPEWVEVGHWLDEPQRPYLAGGMAPPESMSALLPLGLEAHAALCPTVRLWRTQSQEED